MSDSLKIISIPAREKKLTEILEIIKKEKSEHPLLVVLPEYFATGSGYLSCEDLTEKTAKDNLSEHFQKQALKWDGTNLVSESTKTKVILNKLIDAARANNAHIFFGGLEEVLGAYSTSGFVITPSEKEPFAAVVRRKRWESPNELVEREKPRDIGEKSFKVIDVEGFKVIPVLCKESWGVHETPELQKKNADLLVIMAEGLMGGSPEETLSQKFYHRARGTKVIKRGGAVVLSDSETIKYPNRLYEGIFTPMAEPKRKEHKGVTYFTHVIKK